MNELQYEKEISDIAKGYEIKHGIIKGNSTVFFVKTGLNGSIYGYENKYLEIAGKVREQFGYTVVISSNPYDKWGGIRFGFTKDHLDVSFKLIDELGGSEVLLFAYSNGALMSLMHGHKYPQIKKMVLVNMPLHFSNLSTVNKKAELYKDLTFIYGSRDDFSFLQKCIKKEIVVVEGEDHNFTKGIFDFKTLPFTYLLSDKL